MVAKCVGPSLQATWNFLGNQSVVRYLVDAFDPRTRNDGGDANIIVFVAYGEIWRGTCDQNYLLIMKVRDGHENGKHGVVGHQMPTSGRGCFM